MLLLVSSDVLPQAVTYIAAIVSVGRAHHLLVESKVVLEVGPVRKIHHNLDSRAALSGGGTAHAITARLAAEGLVQTLSECDAHIFGRVVVINEEVTMTLGGDAQPACRAKHT
mgnify:CR=1 FL=1